MNSLRKKKEIKLSIEIADLDNEEYYKRANELFEIKWICRHKGNTILMKFWYKKYFYLRQSSSSMNYH